MFANRPKEMEVTVKREPTKPVVCVEGFLTRRTCPEFSEALNNALSTKPPRLTIDLSNTSSVSTGGVHEIIEANDTLRTRRNRKPVTVVTLNNPEMDEALHDMGLSKFVRMVRMTSS